MKFFDILFETSSMWFVSSFAAASLDALVGRMNFGGYVMNTLASLAQLTIAIILSQTMYLYIDKADKTADVSRFWLTAPIIWTMSPNAAEKLINSYFHFHKLLYGSDNSSSGSGSVPPSTGSGNTDPPATTEPPTTTTNANCPPGIPGEMINGVQYCTASLNTWDEETQTYDHLNTGKFPASWFEAYNCDSTSDTCYSKGHPPCSSNQWNDPTNPNGSCCQENSDKTGITCYNVNPK